MEQTVKFSVIFRKLLIEFGIRTYFVTEKNGVKGDVLLWIKSYLKHRTQKEFVNSVLSSETSINAGVPQGSVLARYYFLINVSVKQGYMMMTLP